MCYNLDVKILKYRFELNNGEKVQIALILAEKIAKFIIKFSTYSSLPSMNLFDRRSFTATRNCIRVFQMRINFNINKMQKCTFSM